MHAKKATISPKPIQKTKSKKYEHQLLNQFYFQLRLLLLLTSVESNQFAVAKMRIHWLGTLALKYSTICLFFAQQSIVWMENKILEIMLYHLFFRFSRTFYFNRIGLDGFNDFMGCFFKAIFDHLFQQICVCILFVWSS